MKVLNGIDTQPLLSSGKDKEGTLYVTIIDVSK